MIRSIAEETHVVEAITPQAGGGALAGDYLNLAMCAHVAVVAHINQANSAPVALTLEQAKDVSGTSSKALTEPVHIQANEDAAAGDLYTEESDAVEYTTGGSTGQKVVIFDIDPSTLDVNNGFKCLAVKAAASNAANIVSAVYVATGLRSRGVSMLVD